MEATFKALNTSRKLIHGFFDKYSLEQLNKIPEGFNNNLIWNIGHVIVAQQSLVYKGSNLPMNISEELVELYKPGTKPTRTITAAEVEELKGLLISLPEKTKADFDNGLFNNINFNERTTGTGFHMASVNDALEFNNFHEGLHLGVMLGIRKFV